MSREKILAWLRKQKNQIMRAMLMRPNVTNGLERLESLECLKTKYFLKTREGSTQFSGPNFAPVLYAFLKQTWQIVTFSFNEDSRPTLRIPVEFPALHQKPFVLLRPLRRDDCKRDAYLCEVSYSV
jgi:hypothetical protein